MAFLDCSRYDKLTKYTLGASTTIFFSFGCHNLLNPTHSICKQANEHSNSKNFKNHQTPKTAHCEVVQTGPKWSKRVQNYPKGSKMVRNGPKLSNMFKILQNGPKLSKIVQNRPKLSKKVRHDPHWSTTSHRVRNGPKRSNMFTKWSKMVQNGTIWSNMV